MALSDGSSEYIVPVMEKLTAGGFDGKSVTLKCGDAIVQGVFVPFGITSNDTADAERTGGIGSTSTKKAK